MTFQPLPRTGLAGVSGSRKPTTAQHVQELLAADINAGRLPPGSKLGFEMLKVRYGVGVSPLREALQHLAAENLVVAEGHVGFRVTPFSVEDLQDIVWLRRTQSVLALRNSISNASPEWEGRVLAAVHQLNRAPFPSDTSGMEADQWEVLHRGFHSALLSACNSQRLLHIVRGLDAQFIRYRRAVLAKYWRAERGTRLVAEHQEMAEAAVNHDEQRAVALLEQHFDQTAQDVLRELTNGLLAGVESQPAPTGAGARRRTAEPAVADVSSRKASERV